MNYYKADLHIHTVLSPCADLDMSPANIIAQAKKKDLAIIGITDHNSTLNCKVVSELGEKSGVLVLPGAEINTSEEIHCLTFFEDFNKLNQFQVYIDKWLPFVKNDTRTFGYQLVVNATDEILSEIESLLIMGLNQTIQQIREEVRELNGIFIPAHINRGFSGLLTQLGFMPENLHPDALEFFSGKPVQPVLDQFPGLSVYTGILSSDAHTPDDIGKKYSNFYLESLSFAEIKMALEKREGRKVEIL